MLVNAYKCLRIFANVQMLANVRTFANVHTRLQMSANVRTCARAEARPTARGGAGEGAPLQLLTPHRVAGCGELARRLWRNYPAAQDVGPIWWRGTARAYMYRCKKSLHKMKKSVKNICNNNKYTYLCNTETHKQGRKAAK